MRDKTQQDIADIFDVTKKTINLWIKKGLPYSSSGTGRGNKNHFDETEVASWMKANHVTGVVGHPNQPTSERMAAAKLRNQEALANLNELKVAREKGILIERSEQEQNNVRKFTILKNKLLGLSSQVSAILAGLEAAEIQEELESRIREVLSELSKQ
jgi:phage terminase Nu1 subunit (DNA packaging protein)